MKVKVGLWIDHKKAVIVFVKDKKIEKKIIKSNVDKQLGRYDGKRSTISYESQLVPAEDSQEKYYRGHINIYYDEVISFIRDAESILVFGSMGLWLVSFGSTPYAGTGAAARGRDCLSIATDLGAAGSTQAG